MQLLVDLPGHLPGAEVLHMEFADFSNDELDLWCLLQSQMQMKISRCSDEGWVISSGIHPCETTQCIRHMPVAQIPETLDNGLPRQHLPGNDR